MSIDRMDEIIASFGWGPPPARKRFVGMSRGDYRCIVCESSIPKGRPGRACKIVLNKKTVHF